MRSVDNSLNCCVKENSEGACPSFLPVIYNTDLCSYKRNFYSPDQYCNRIFSLKFFDREAIFLREGRVSNSDCVVQYSLLQQQKRMR